MAPTTDDAPNAPSGGGSPIFRLRLFVAGNEPNSFKAKAALARLTEQVLRGRCEVEVVDVLEDYQAAVDRQVMAVPALIVESPPPVRTVFGSLTDEDRLLAALGLSKEGGP